MISSKRRGEHRIGVKNRRDIRLLKSSDKQQISVRNFSWSHQGQDCHSLSVSKSDKFVATFVATITYRSPSKHQRFPNLRQAISAWPPANFSSRPPSFRSNLSTEIRNSPRIPEMRRFPGQSLSLTRWPGLKGIDGGVHLRSETRPPSKPSSPPWTSTASSTPCAPHLPLR